jgi:hypothetical protein
MTRTDRRLWKTTESLADLGNLTARWLEGDIASQPGYQPNYGPDDETLPLIGTLAACNRGGYLTSGSQPGTDPETVDGLHWHQRAAVEGYAIDPSLIGRLVGAAEAAGLDIVLTDDLDTEEAGAVVTLLNGQPYTRFGAHLAPRDLRSIWQGIGETAMSDIFAATRITLATKEWGTEAGHDLWAFLDDFFGNTASPYAAPLPRSSSPRTRIPNRAARYLMGLVGKTWAYDSREDVDRELDRVAGEMSLRRWPDHQAGAARLQSPFDFQPGLLNEYGQAHDAMLYVRSLALAAHRQEHHDLGNILTEAEEALSDAVQRLADAAVATTGTPAPATSE